MNDQSTAQRRSYIVPRFRRPTGYTARPPSPTSDSPNSSGTRVPVGNELIVHNVPGQDIASRVRFVQSIIQRGLEKNEELPPLEVVPPGSNGCGNFVYIRLDKDLSTECGIPRPDLLQDWIATLETEFSSCGCSVDWVNAQRGRDKRLWVQIMDIPQGRDDAKDLIKRDLEQAGLNVASVFSLKSGGIVVIFAMLNDARSVQDQQVISVPSLSMHPIPVRPLRVVQPIYPFEMIITGTQNYDVPSVARALDNYFHRTYMDDEGTMFCGSRIDDQDNYCFSMKDWNAAVMVLDDHAKFRADFQHCENLSTPRLIFDHNSFGYSSPKITNSNLNEAADSVKQSLATVYRRIEDLQTEVRMGFAAAEKRFGEVANTISIMQSTVEYMAHQVQIQSAATMQINLRVSLMHRKTQIAQRIMSFEDREEMAAKSNDTVAQSDIQAKLRDLRRELMTIEDQIMTMGDEICETMAPQITPHGSEPETVRPARRVPPPALPH